MLVNFKDLKDEVIFFRKDYTDVSPILSMVEQMQLLAFFRFKWCGTGHWSVP